MPNNNRQKYLINFLILIIIMVLLSVASCSKTHIYTTQNPRVFSFFRGKEIVPDDINERIIEAIRKSVNLIGNWDLKKREEKGYFLKFTDDQKSFTHIIWVENGKLFLRYFESKNYGYTGKTMSSRYWIQVNSLIHQAKLLVRAK